MKRMRLYYHRKVDDKPDTEKSHLRENIANSRPTLDLLADILTDRLEELDRDLDAKTLYEKQSYAYKLADVLGARREVRKLLKQLEDRSDHD